MTASVRRPAAPGLYVLDGEGRPLLLVSRCSRCGARSFPARRVCADCFSGELETEQYGPAGELYAFTVVHETFGRGSLPPPYGVAKVRLADGFMVQGLLDPAVHGWQVGMDVETTEIVLEREGEDELMTYAFRPGAAGAEQERRGA